jgi:hypothetical protein
MVWFVTKIVTRGHHLLCCVPNLTYHSHSTLVEYERGHRLVPLDASRRRTSELGAGLRHPGDPSRSGPGSRATVRSGTPPDPRPQSHARPAPSAPPRSPSSPGGWPSWKSPRDPPPRSRPSSGSDNGLVLGRSRMTDGATAEPPTTTDRRWLMSCGACSNWGRTPFQMVGTAAAKVSFSLP